MKMILAPSCEKDKAEESIKKLSNILPELCKSKIEIKDIKEIIKKTQL